MPPPKRRHSNQRTRKRRTHWKLSIPGHTKCSNCGEPKSPHTVCSSCGFYAGKQIIIMND